LQGVPLIYSMKNKERYLPKIFTYEVTNRKKVPSRRTYTERLSDGSYRKKSYYKRKNGVVEQVVYWKFVNTKTKKELSMNKRTKEITWEDRDISYDRFVEKTLNKINRKRKHSIDVSFSVQKFIGKVRKPSQREIVGSITKSLSTRSIKKKKRMKLDIDNFQVDVENIKDELESLFMYQYEIVKGKISKIRKVKGRKVKVKARNKKKRIVIYHS
jgi:hypothetical protein